MCVGCRFLLHDSCHQGVHALHHHHRSVGDLKLVNLSFGEIEQIHELAQAVKRSWISRALTAQPLYTMALEMAQLAVLFMRVCQKSTTTRPRSEMRAIHRMLLGEGRGDG